MHMPIPALDVTDWLVGALSSLPDWLVTLIISMMPFVELRLSIPVAIGLYKMDPTFAFIVALIGNLIPVPFILLFLGKIETWLSSRYQRWERFFKWLFKYTRKRAGDKISKSKMIGLALYVAIPLPITGAWTGALIAYVFNFDIKKAFISIVCGVLIAGIIVTMAVVGVVSIWGV
jgi:uncharacterized membrane protein